MRFLEYQTESKLANIFLPEVGSRITIYQKKCCNKDRSDFILLTTSHSMPNKPYRKLTTMVSQTANSKMLTLCKQFHCC